MFNAYLQDKFLNASKSECEFFAANTNWCYADKIAIKLMIEEQCQKFIDNIKNISVLEMIDKSALDIDLFFGINTDKKALRKIFTSDGICYTDNLQDFSTIFNEENIHEDFKNYFKDKNNLPTEWTLDRGYFSANSSYPYRAKRTVIVGFFPTLKKMDAENICIIKMFKIIPHLPNEIPTEFHRTRFYLNYNENLGIEVRAKSIRISDDLRRISPDRRNCYFDGERTLKFFKSYSRAHCNLECIANITLKKCGCVKFYMPRDKNTTVCTYGQQECKQKANLNTELEMLACACHSPCNDIKYNYELFRTSINFESASGNEERINSILDVQFVGEHVEEIEHYIAYKLQNFISDVGGLLGLFMGCSVISIVEIIYLIIKSVVNYLIPKTKVNQSEIKATQRKIDVSFIEENPINLSLLEIKKMINDENILIKDLKEHAEKQDNKIDKLSKQLQNVNQRLENVEKYNLFLDDY